MALSWVKAEYAFKMLNVYAQKLKDEKKKRKNSASISAV
jgi:hypothetical protein